LKGTKSIREEVCKFIRDRLESRGTPQEIRTVEIGIDGFTEYLENADLKSWIGDLWNILGDIRRIGDLIWYYDHEKKKVVVLEVSDK
jgi:hypothetical protein